MESLRFTLLTNGSSDQALIPILRWLLVRNGVTGTIDPSWADLRRLPHPPQGLANRIRIAVDIYPCDLLFVHRDAERMQPELRKSEIRDAIQSLLTPPVVCVVPVRMQEAWLLIEEAAIRQAAGNPQGQVPLSCRRFGSWSSSRIRKRFSMSCFSRRVASTDAAS
jgi:hypothetical protein